MAAAAAYSSLRTRSSFPSPSDPPFTFSPPEALPPPPVSHRSCYCFSLFPESCLSSMRSPHPACTFPLSPIRDRSGMRASPSETIRKQCSLDASQLLSSLILLSSLPAAHSSLPSFPDCSFLLLSINEKGVPLIPEQNPLRCCKCRGNFAAIKIRNSLIIRRLCKLEQNALHAYDRYMQESGKRGACIGFSPKSWPRDPYCVCEPAS